VTWVARSWMDAEDTVFVAPQSGRYIHTSRSWSSVNEICDNSVAASICCWVLRCGRSVRTSMAAFRKLIRWPVCRGWGLILCSRGGPHQGSYQNEIDLPFFMWYVVLKWKSSLMEWSCDPKKWSGSRLSYVYWYIRLLAPMWSLRPVPCAISTTTILT
jgi:hypothetical protein